MLLSGDHYPAITIDQVVSALLITSTNPLSLLKHSFEQPLLCIKFFAVQTTSVIRFSGNVVPILSFNESPTITTFFGFDMLRSTLTILQLLNK